MEAVLNAVSQAPYDEDGDDGHVHDKDDQIHCSWLAYAAYRYKTKCYHDKNCKTAEIYEKKGKEYMN